MMWGSSTQTGWPQHLAQLWVSSKHAWNTSWATTGDGWSLENQWSSGFVWKEYPYTHCFTIIFQSNVPLACSNTYLLTWFLGRYIQYSFGHFHQTVLRLPNSDTDRAERTNIQFFTGPSWQMCLKNGYEFCCSLWGFGKIGCPLSQTNKNLKGNPIRPPAPILLSFTRSRPQWLGGVAVSPRPLLSSHPALFSGLESMFSFSQMQAK